MSSAIKGKLLVSIKIANCRSEEMMADSISIAGDSVLDIRKKSFIKLDPHLHSSLYSKYYGWKKYLTVHFFHLRKKLWVDFFLNKRN